MKKEIKKSTSKKSIKSVKPKTIERKKKISKTKSNSALYLYSSAITIILVLSNSIMGIPFQIFGIDVYLSVFTYPFLFLFTYLIFKKYGLKETVEAIIISLVIQMLMFFLRWIFFEEIEAGLFVATFISFVTSESLCIFLCSIIMQNRKMNLLFLFLVFALSILFDNVLFLTIINLLGNEKIILETLSLTNFIKLAMAFIVSVIAIEIE